MCAGGRFGRVLGWFATLNAGVALTGRLSAALPFVLVIAERFESRILQWRGLQRLVVDPRALVNVVCNLVFRAGRYSRCSKGKRNDANNRADTLPAWMRAHLSTAAMHSSSTRAPRARPLAPKALRAG